MDSRMKGLGKQINDPFPIPLQLEYKVILKLRDLGLLNNKKYFSVVSLKISFAILLIFIGTLIGYTLNSGITGFAQSTYDSKYVLLLYNNNNLTGTESERVTNYSAWVRKLAAEQKVVSGEKLRSTGFLLSSSGISSKASGDSIYVNPRTMSGYFVIQANNYEEALIIAKSCPHIKYGGKIEVREITKLNNTNI